MTVLDHVRSTISKHRLLTKGDRVVMGVSGGPDSLTLLHVLRALRDEWQIHLHVAHLNHQLRGAESDADAESVARLAREWNLPATVQAGDVTAYAREKKLSIEEAAREMRYAFLVEVAQGVNAGVIAVAHNADDQVETVVMHLLRGAGMAGLRGMPYKFEIRNSKFAISGLRFTNYDLRIIRPLLDVTRAKVEAYCKENALNPRLDRSNLDTTLFRNRLRQQVLPYLETFNPNLREVLLHTSRALADDYDYLQAQAREAFARVAREQGGAIVFTGAAWRALHPSLQRAMLRLAFEKLRGDYRNLAWTHIEEARRIALEKGVGAEAILPCRLKLVVGYDEFFIAAEAGELPLPDLPQLNVECLALPTRGLVELPQSDWVVEAVVLNEPHPNLPLKGRIANHNAFKPSESSKVRDALRGKGLMALFDLDKCRGEIFLRRRRTGDRFQPAGMDGHTKSLHELMIDEKIPRGARGHLPLLATRDRILWVCGYRVDERARVTDATREILQVIFRKKG